MSQSILIFLLSLILACGRTEPAEEEAKEATSSEEVKLPKETFVYKSVELDSIHLVSSRSFEMNYHIQTLQEDKTFVYTAFQVKGQYSLKLNGFHRFEVTELVQETQVESPIEVGQVFYGRLASEEAIIALHPMHGGPSLWLQKLDCETTKATSFSFEDPAIKQAVKNNQFERLASRWSSSIRELKLNFEEPLFFKDFEIDVETLKSSFNCLGPESTAATTQGSTFTKSSLVGQYRQQKETDTIVDVSGVFLIAEPEVEPKILEKEFWGVGILGDKARFFQIEAQPESEAGFSLAVSDIQPKDSVTGNSLNLQTRLEQVSAFLFESTGDPKLQCKINKAQLTWRSQWMICQGIVLQPPARIPDFLFFMAQSKQRKFTKEEKTERRRAEEEKLEALKKKIAEEKAAANPLGEE